LTVTKFQGIHNTDDDAADVIAVYVAKSTRNALIRDPRCSHTPV